MTVRLTDSLVKLIEKLQTDCALFRRAFNDRIS